jgi:hypothetical protein
VPQKCPNAPLFARSHKTILKIFQFFFQGLLKLWAKSGALGHFWGIPFSLTSLTF